MSKLDLYEMARRKINREYSTALGAASGIDADKAERERHAKLVAAARAVADARNADSIAAALAALRALLEREA